MTNKAIVTILALAAACTVASAQTYKYIDKTIAVIGNEAVMISDIENTVKERGAQGLNSDRNVRCEVLENTLESKLLLMQARIDSLNVAQDNVEAMLAQRIDTYLTYLGGQEALEKYFKAPIPTMRAISRRSSSVISSNLPSSIEVL